MAVDYLNLTPNEIQVSNDTAAAKDAEWQERVQALEAEIQQLRDALWDAAKALNATPTAAWVNVKARVKAALGDKE